jgi:hypothetical protein
MSRPDNQVREELLKLAQELVNDRFEKDVARLQNDAQLTQGSGQYTLPTDNRAVEAQRIARDWFDVYAPRGGDAMLNALKEAYELADQQYQDAVEVRVFNAIKYTDETKTVVSTRAAYTLPTDRRETDTAAYAVSYYELMNNG